MCGTIQFGYNGGGTVFGTFPANANGNAALIASIMSGDVSIINDAAPPFDVTYDLATGIFSANSLQVCPATPPELTIQGGIIFTVGTSGTDYPLPAPFTIDFEVKITDDTGSIVYTDDVGSVSGDILGNLTYTGSLVDNGLEFDLVSVAYGGAGGFTFEPTAVSDTITALPSQTFKMTVSATSTQVSPDVSIYSILTIFWKTPNAGSVALSQKNIPSIPLARRVMLDCERKIMLGF